NKELDKTVTSIEQKAQADFKKEKSILLGIKKDAKILFQASKLQKYPIFEDKNTLDILLKLQSENQLDGFITFTFNKESYFGVYKYHPKWEIFLVRAEEFGEFYAATTEIFKRVSLVIIAMTIVCAIIGIFLMRFILRYLKIITAGIIQMTRNQKLETIDIERAPADDITFLGVAFNSLANTINNLMNIFKKFTNRDIVLKAYRDKYIKLEGTRRELTCLFSDIKSFTYMTEVLGTDIITLLNLHYTRAINAVLEEDGIIGSIIGDALLAVYGALEESQGNKSYQAIRSAYEIHRVAQTIRKKMEEIKDKILSERGFLTPKEEKVYKAVLIEVGVGIDGGLVFYGNIGSYERMTNTVIG
ncbi:MAG: adenylate/guanylate cyclase domain-containing protein, partial [Spirochaetae bacterium HGW-Spirochaetae-6]